MMTVPAMFGPVNLRARKNSAAHIAMITSASSLLSTRAAVAFARVNALVSFDPKLPLTFASCSFMDIHFPHMVC